MNPGDLVIADEVGVCFVPFGRAAEVLAVAQRLKRTHQIPKLSYPFTSE